MFSLKVIGKSLLPARRAWKGLTAKLQTKLLHKLHSSKSFKKPSRKSSPLYAAAAARRAGGVPLPSLYLRAHGSRRKRLLLAQPAGRSLRHHRRSHKSVAPVYVDELFKESLPGKLVVAERLWSTPVAKKLTAGTSKERGKAAPVGDELWESLAVASPQMRGIDERAEEFITRFRAEMKMQETLARDL